jgi:hypothetical protein
MKICHRLHLALSLVAAQLIIACDDPAGYQIESQGILEGKAADSDDGSGAQSKDPKVSESSFELTIASRSETEFLDQKQNIYFLLDSSPSMVKHINNLASSLPTLFAGLNDKKLNFGISVSTFGNFIQQLQFENNAYYPTGQTFNAAPNWDRSSEKKAVYDQVKSFQGSLGIQPALDALNRIAASPTQNSNEPGACAMLDLLLYQNAKQAFEAGSSTQILFVSDEQNARSYGQYSNSGLLERTYELYCHVRGEATRNVTERYNRLITADVYRYTYSEPTTGVSHTGSYDIESRCYSQGYAAANEARSLERYVSTHYFANPIQEYTCSRVVPNFQCSFPGGSPITSATNYSTSKSCQVPNSYNCTQIHTKHSCSAGVAGTPSAVSNQIHWQPITGRKRCEVAQNYECRTFIDGEPFWFAKNRAQALTIIASEGASACRNPSNWAAADLDTSVNDLGVRSCGAYVCQQFRDNATVGRGEAIDFMNRGGACTVADSNPPRQNFASSTTESYLQDCRPYNCSTVNLSQSSANVSEADRPNWQVCSPNPVGYTGITPMFQANHSGNGALASITERLRPAGAVEIHSNQYTIADNVCQNNSVSFDSTKISRNLNGGTSPASRLNQLYEIRAASLMSADQIRAHIRTQLGSAIGPFETIVLKPGTTANYESGTTNKTEVFNYQAYPAGHSKRNLANFQEQMIQYRATLDNGTLTLPPAANISTNHTYLVTDNIDPNGRYSRTVSVASNGTRKVASTPEDVMSFMKESLPTQAITYNAIIYDPKNCSSGAVPGASFGEDYKIMAEASKGVVGSICANDFKDFFTSLFLNITNQLVLSYEIPKEYKGQTFIRVVNLSTKQELKEGADYVVEKNNIYFKNPAAIEKGDEIRFYY